MVVDEFTSVVDRQIAKIGALRIFQSLATDEKAMRALSCHYDIIEWSSPTGYMIRPPANGPGGVSRTPKTGTRYRQTDWRYRHLFELHHYLKLPKMVAATNYVGVIDGELVAHIAFPVRPD